ncbi:hypothetical protein [Cytophaga aurantiaca]|uniref:hypothetical protein n=1 Tax=Cytophaga aurantiaca TaxID=29530 RepID=UPI0003702F45|nr:hypothetical protein [Cytophaga aurantiaca]
MEKYFIYLLTIFLCATTACINEPEPQVKQRELVSCDFNIKVVYVRSYFLKLGLGTLIYEINKDEIKITNHSDIVYIKDTVVFSKQSIGDSLVDYFCSLQLDSLEGEYNRNNRAIFSGTSTLIRYKKGDYEKGIWLQNDSHPATDEIILTINKIVPEAYQIKIPKAGEYIN